MRVAAVLFIQQSLLIYFFICIFVCIYNEKNYFMVHYLWIACYIRLIPTKITSIIWLPICSIILTQFSEAWLNYLLTYGTSYLNYLLHFYIICSFALLHLYMLYSVRLLTRLNSVTKYSPTKLRQNFSPTNLNKGINSYLFNWRSFKFLTN